MRYNMREWLANLARDGKRLPFLSYPGILYTAHNIYDITHNSHAQADCVVAAVEHYQSMPAAIMPIDLSVEAEALGADVVCGKNELPRVERKPLNDITDLHKLSLATKANRMDVFCDAIALVKEKITDKPCIAGMIGPFSLVGRLMGDENALSNCITDEAFVSSTLMMITPVLGFYAKALYQSGADGIILNESLAGMLSPQQEMQFSAPYCTQIIKSVQKEDFAVIYRNCGPSASKMTESLVSNGAFAYHFGDETDMEDIKGKIPPDRIYMGNISPSENFVSGSVDDMKMAVAELYEKMKGECNFVLSSGGDIPYNAKEENIRAFFE